MEWTPRPLVEHLREQERPNATVITVGSKYEVYVRSPTSSAHANLQQPFRTLAINWEVNVVKEIFLRPFFMRCLLLRLLSLRRYVSSIYMYATHVRRTFQESALKIPEVTNKPITQIINNPHHHHHHLVVPSAQISLTLSRHLSLSFIASARSSGLHPVSSQSYCI